MNYNYFWLKNELIIHRQASNIYIEINTKTSFTIEDIWTCDAKVTTVQAKLSCCSHINRQTKNKYRNIYIEYITHG